MHDTAGPARVWTKRYRLAAGVYAMRSQQILMLERAQGMLIGFWSIPGGIVDPGETPQEAAARELFEEAGLTPTGPLWLVTAVPLKGYGMGLLSLCYACPCDAGEVRLSHEHTGWSWMDPAAYRATHVGDAAVARWRQSSPEEAFNVVSNRNGLMTFSAGAVTEGGGSVSPPRGALQEARNRDMRRALSQWVG